MIEHVSVGVVGDRQGIVLARRKRQPNDGLRIGLDLCHHRVLDSRGHERPRPRHAITHVVRSRIGIALAHELDGDGADLVFTLGFDCLDALDAGKLIFERLSDLAFHNRRRRAEIDGAHRHGRRVDIGILAHR